MTKQQELEAPQHLTQEQVMTELVKCFRWLARGLSAACDAYAAEWNSRAGKTFSRRVRLLNPLYMNAVASDVTKLNMPLLLFWGERDATTPLALGQRIAREAGTPHWRRPPAQAA